MERAGRGVRWALPLLLLGGLGVGALWWRPPLMRDPGQPDQVPALRLGNPAARFPYIRVCLTPQPVSTVEVTLAGPYELRPVGSPRVLQAGERLGTVQLTTTGTGFQVGSRTVPVTRIELVSRDGELIWLNDHGYRGSLVFYRRTDGQLLVVNQVPFDAYLASVIDSEMPAAFGPEARKAQAVVARTYALWQLQIASSQRGYDLFASTRSQKYLGAQYRSSDGRLLAGESADSRRFVQETAGMVCAHRGQLFSTYYSACCGGRTVNGLQLFSDAAPCLRSVSCDWCSASSRYRWKSSLSRNVAESRLQAWFARQGRRFGRLQSIAEESHRPGEFPVFVVSDGQSSHRIGGDALRSALSAHGVYSQRYSLVLTKEELLIEGYGHGHGIGLCQWGARGQGLEGRTGVQIVEYYYPGAQVVRLIE